MCGKVDVISDSEESGPGDCDKDIVRCSLRCRVWIGLHLDLGFGCDVSESMRLMF